MKLLSKFLFVSLGLLLSCKKVVGPGGENKIEGTIVCKNGVNANSVAPNATVYISYGAKEPTNEYNQAILCDINGNYKIEGLQKGSYFLKASYTDANGFYYTTAGYAIELNNKKSIVRIDITLE